jgi:hypothetical protein
MPAIQSKPLEKGVMISDLIEQGLPLESSQTLQKWRALMKNHSGLDSSNEEKLWSVYVVEILDSKALAERRQNNN